MQSKLIKHSAQSALCDDFKTGTKWRNWTWIITLESAVGAD